MFKTALKELGFADVYETALGMTWDGGGSGALREGRLLPVSSSLP